MAIYPKEYLDTATGDTERRSCFVLMPFAGRFDEVYSAIRKACENPEALLSCSRADDFYGAGHIMEGILEGIVRSEYIVADFTDKNPNVFYELGIAHCCKDASKVIILTQTMEDVPFDLRHLRCIPYRPDPAGLRQLEHDVVRAFKSDAGDIHRFAVSDNGTYDFTHRLSGRGGNFYTFRITQLWIGGGKVKMSVLVQRQSLVQGPADFGPSVYLLEVDKATEIPETDSALKVDRIEEGRAFFSVIPRSAMT